MTDKYCIDNGFSTTCNEVKLYVTHARNWLVCATADAVDSFFLFVKGPVIDSLGFKEVL